MFLEAGLTPPTATFTSDSYFGALALLQNLDAVCTFPVRLLNEMQKTWDLVQFDLDWEFPKLKISAMTRTATPLTPAGDALLNCVRRRVATREHEHGGNR